MTDSVDSDRAWMGRLECGCVVAVDCFSPAELEEDADLIIEETTVGEARRLLTFAHGRPTCEVLAERDAARVELARKDKALTDIAALAKQWRAQAALLESRRGINEHQLNIRRACAGQVDEVLASLTEPKDGNDE